MGVGGNMRILSASAVLVGMLAAAALPGIASAHRQPPVNYVSTAVSTAPTVNGVLGAGEWDDAPSSFLLFGEISGFVRFKHDSQYLYVAVTVADGVVGTKSIGMYFDDDHDGLKDPGEDAILSFVGAGNTGSDFYWSSTGDIGGASHYGDGSNAPGTTPPGNGTNDVIAGGTEVGGQVTFELRHPLCSTDDVHDVCLRPGDTAGVHFQYQSGGPFWGARGHRALTPATGPI